MARFKKIPIRTEEGKITYGDGIVDGIVLLAISEIPYVELYSTSPRKKMRSSAINVNFEKDGVHVVVIVKIHYSQSVSDMSFKIQEAVRHNVESMTEYRMACVNVIVRGILFDEKIEEKPVPVVNENQVEASK